MLIYLSLLLLISKKTCDYMFPERMNKVYTSVALHCLNVYTSIHMFIRKVYNWILLNIRNQNDFITFIKNGHEIKICERSQLMYLKENTDNYEMVLYTNFIKSNDILTKNVLRLSNIINKNYLINPNIISSNIKFIDIRVLYNDSNYVIDFGKDNYYIVGNVLFDRSFIKWYLNMYHSVFIDDDEDYICHILDDNVNFIQIDSSSYVVIEKDKYTIENTKKSEEFETEL